MFFGGHFSGGLATLLNTIYYFSNRVLCVWSAKCWTFSIFRLVFTASHVEVEEGWSGCPSPGVVEPIVTFMLGVEVNTHGSLTNHWGNRWSGIPSFNHYISNPIHTISFGHMHTICHTDHTHTC